MLPIVFVALVLAMGSTRTTLSIRSFNAFIAYHTAKVDSVVKCLRDNIIQITCIQECSEEKWEMSYYNTIFSYNNLTDTGTYHSY